MTHTDYTKLILNIKDNNIYFDENCLEIININNIETKVFHGYLTYIPEYCPKCGCINESPNDIIKWRNCKIKITKTCGYNSLLILDKQRFLCKHCNRTFTASTNVVDYHKQISNDTNLNIKLELMQKGSEKDITKRNNVSTNHVNRILHQISEDRLVKNYGKLPSIIGFDEFNAPKILYLKWLLLLLIKIIVIYLISTIVVYQLILKNILKDILNKKEIKLKLLQWIYINLIINSCIIYLEMQY